MKYLLDLVTNPVFLSAAVSWFTAQSMKMIIETIKNGFDPKRLSGGGGMPSSHSATVTGLVFATAIEFGLGGFEFPMALFFAIIVIYDARGVRYQTGRQSSILNQMREQEISAGRKPAVDIPLDENIGHSIPEIIAGCLTGAVCGTIISLLLS